MSSGHAPDDLPPGDDPRPVPPERPGPDECCGGGCPRCVFDEYDDALQRYEEALAAWRSRHPAQPPRA